jgi:trigger factor
MSNSTLKDAIEVNLTEIEPCLKRAEYTVPSEALGKETKLVVKEVAKYQSIPGFRKGKAPASLIASRFQDQIKEELIRRCFSSAFEKTGEDKDLDIVSYAMPEGAQPEYKQGEDYIFAINFDIAPEIKLPEYQGIEIEGAGTEVTDKEIEERIDYYRNMYADYKTLDDAKAEKEDMLKVSYTSDFVVAEDASPSLKRQVNAEESWIWLNEPEVIPGAIEGLTGAEKGGEYKLTAVYPEDYRESELAGKTVNYDIKVVEVQRRYPLKSDEELCEKMKLENIDKLKEQIKLSAAMEKEQKNRGELREKIVEKLIADTEDFPIPPTIFNNEVRKQLQNIARTIVKSEEDVKAFQEDKEKHEDEAQKTATERMRRFFILKKIADLEDINVDSKEVDQQIKGLSSYYGYKEKELRRMMEQSGGLEDMQIDIMMNKVTDFLLDKAEIKEAGK